MDLDYINEGELTTYKSIGSNKLMNNNGSNTVIIQWPSKLQIEQATLNQLKDWKSVLVYSEPPETTEYQRTVLTWINFRIEFLGNGIA